MSVVYDLSTSHNQKKSFLTAFGVFLLHFPPLFSLQATVAKIATVENASQYTGGCKRTVWSLDVTEKKRVEGDDGPGGAAAGGAPSLPALSVVLAAAAAAPARSLRRGPPLSRAPASCSGLWGKAAVCQPCAWKAGGL